MFQRAPEPVSPSPRAKRVLWALATLDVMAAVWMLTAGEWIDHRSPVMTLGGHHLVVVWLAVLAFATLAVVAPLTGGFATVGRIALAALSIAGVVSVVALTGMLSVVGLVVGVALLVGLLGRALH